MAVSIELASVDTKPPPSSAPSSASAAPPAHAVGVAPRPTCLQRGLYCGGASRAGCGRRVRQFVVDHFTYHRLHLAWFCFMGLMGAIGLLIAEGNAHNFVDYLFMSVSAVSVTGLSTLDVSSMHFGSQVIMFFLMMGGSVILSSTFPVFIRRRYFKRRALEEAESPAAVSAILASEVEYKALTWILRIAIGYYFGTFLVMLLLWGIYMNTTDFGDALLARNAIDSPWWFAAFHSAASIQNAGFALMNDNFVQLASNHFLLITSSAFILLGNTMFPPALRLIVWAFHHAKPHDPSLKYLLDKPRRVYTHLFPDRANWLIVYWVAGSTMFQFFLFLIMNRGDERLPGVSGPVKALMGWFQSVSTRSAGFNVVDISSESASLQFIYAALMFVASYPVTMAMRASQQERKGHGHDDHDHHHDGEEEKAKLAVISEGGAGEEAAAATGAGADMPAAAVAALAAVAAADGTPTGSIGSLRGARAPLATRRGVTSMVFFSESRRQLAVQGAPAAPEGVAVEVAAAGDAAPAPAAAPADASTATTTELALKDGGESVTSDDPLAAAVARTHSYDFRELGITHDDLPDDVKAGAAQKVAQNLLTRDILWLFAAFFVICIAEDRALSYDANPKWMNPWSVIFEISSAYGCQGLTIGYPGSVVSLSGQFNVVAKLAIIAVMMAGRHRGLPLSIDPAVYLPGLMGLKSKRKSTAAAAGAGAATTSVAGAGTGVAGSSQGDATSRSSGSKGPSPPGSVLTSPTGSLILPSSNEGTIGRASSIAPAALVKGAFSRLRHTRTTEEGGAAEAGGSGGSGSASASVSPAGSLILASPAK